MTNTKFFAITSLTGLVLLTVFAQNALAGVGGTTAEDDWETPVAAKAVPDWVDNNFKWYGEGKIAQSDLLNSLTYMLDNGLMHLSDKAAQEMHDLRTENAAYKKKLGVDGIVAPKTAASSKGAEVKSLQNQLNEDSTRISSIQVPNEDGELVSVLVVSDNTTDVNALVQAVLRQSYMETSKDLQFYAEKVKHFNDMKEAIRDHMSDMRNKRQMAVTSFENANESSLNPDVLNPDIFNPDLVNAASLKLRELTDAGETSTKYWKDRYFEDTPTKTTDSTIDELNGIVVLCNVALDNQVQHNETDLEFLKELADTIERYSADARITTSAPTTQSTIEDLVLKRAENLEKKIESLQVGMNVCEDKLSSLDEQLQGIGDDAQLANIDLQNALQKQQQTMQMMSNIMKSQHDTLKAIINNMRA